jgi:predicted metal-dependent peptidase
MALDFAAVRLAALTKRPYLALSLTALVPVRRPGLGTFAVDRRGRVYWDPTLSWKVAEASWALLHELQHWLRGHADRAETLLGTSACKAHTAWLINRCTDAEINDDLEAEGGRLPAHETRIFPRTLQQPVDLFWEQYYAAIRDDDTSTPPLMCGSAAHGLPQDYEEGDDSSVPGYGPVEVDLIRDQTARDILAHVRLHGSLPGRTVRWATERLRAPTIPWERTLMAQTHAACRLATGCEDYSYARRSRRGTFNGVLLPAMVRRLPRVVIVLDTSSSMGAAEELPLALAEIPGIVRAIGQHAVSVICCDTEAAAAQLVRNVDQLQLVGGGGTYLGNGLEAARKHGDVVILLTDGHTLWPTSKPVPSQEIIVALIGAHAAPVSTVPSYVRAVVHVQRGLS